MPGVFTTPHSDYGEMGRTGLRVGCRHITDTADTARWPSIILRLIKRNDVEISGGFHEPAHIQQPKP